MNTKTPPAPLTLDEVRQRAVLSLPEAAAVLGVSRPHIYVLANRGEVPTLSLGARRVVSAPLLLHMLMSTGDSEYPSEDLTASTP